MKKIQSDMEVLSKYKITIYPVYFHRDEYKKNVLTYRKNNWYLVVNNNGHLTTYTKSLGVGKILDGKKLIVPIERTALYWRQKVDKLKSIRNE